MSDRLNDAMKILAEGAVADRDCPTPEIWHEFASGLLGEQGTFSSAGHWTGAALESHAADCGVCAAELDLASAFVEEAAEARNQSDEAVPGMVARDEAHDASGSRVVSIETARDARRGQEIPAPTPAVAGRRAWLAAAAVILALTGGYSLWTMRPPAVQGPGTGAVMRGTAIALTTPLDEVVEIPGTFEWESPNAADHYRVEVRRLDGRVVLEREVTEPVLELTAAEREALQPFVTYEWSVEARAGGEVQTSASASFTIRVPPGVTN